MSELTITGGLVLTLEGLQPRDVRVAGGSITSIDRPVSEPGDLDATGLVVAPGFVDSHVHGALGRNFMMADPDALDVVGNFLLTRGVTSVVMGTASLPRPEFGRAVAAMAALVGRRPNGLHVLGIHLEGPFLSQSHRGVHRTDAVRAPAADEIDGLLDDLGSALRIVTLAPELPGALDAIRRLTAAGVTVSLGHSGADGDTARRAIAAGARRVTHLYNAVPKRTDGSLVDVALRTPEVFLELIADGHHVAPPMLARTFAEAGARRIVIVSDGSDVTGLGDGPHRRWEGTDVIVRDGQSRTPGGTLAGSICPLDGSLRTLVENAGLSLEDALCSLSSVPARSIGEHGKGRIAVGADADLVLVDPATATVRATVAGGRIAYLSEGLSANLAGYRSR